MSSDLREQEQRRRRSPVSRPSEVRPVAQPPRSGSPPPVAHQKTTRVSEAASTASAAVRTRRSRTAEGARATCREDHPAARARWRVAVTDTTVPPQGEAPTWPGSESGKDPGARRGSPGALGRQDAIGGDREAHGRPATGRGGDERAAAVGLRDVVDDRQPEPGAGQAAGGVGAVEAVEHPRGVGGRDAGTAGRAPWSCRDGSRSSIGSVPSASNLAAFSSRLPTARSSAPRRPRTTRAVGVDADATPAAPPHPLGGAIGHLGESDDPPRAPRCCRESASSTSSSTRWRELAGLALDVGDEAVRASGESSAKRRSTLALVRRLVSGVRSSWAASWTSRSWASRAAASRASIVVNEPASRPTSSRPATGTRDVDARPCVG